VLDIGSGSGASRSACAKAFPALALTASTYRPRPRGRSHQRRSPSAGPAPTVAEVDHFSALGDEKLRYFVTNPPYVGDRELKSLPAEYRHEARIALAAGRAGLDSVRSFLQEAACICGREDCWSRGGNTETRCAGHSAQLPFTWLRPLRTRRRPVSFLLTAERGLFIAIEMSGNHRSQTCSRNTYRREPRTGVGLHRRRLSSGLPLSEADASLTSIAVAPAPRTS